MRLPDIHSAGGGGGYTQWGAQLSGGSKAQGCQAQKQRRVYTTGYVLGSARVVIQNGDE
jgi:hypothetical protein